MVRLTDGLQLQAGETAVYERLRGLVADAMVGAVEGRPLLNGTPFELSQGDRNWLVHVQDVEGLVDLYLSPRDTLALLPLDVDRFVATRDRVLAGLIPGERFPTLGASLARFGASEADLGGLVTQGSQTGSLRLLTLPQALLVRAQGIPAGVRQGEQVQRVVIEIEPK